MMKIHSDFEKLIALNLPKDSAIIKRIGVKQVNGSTFLEVHHIITEEYRSEHDLTYRERVMQIRIVKGENDYGLPISSFADVG